jgi:RHS repeat-associated protein
MSIASLRFSRSIAARALLLWAALGASPVAHAQEFVAGRIATRGVVKRADNGEIALNGQPTWVMYDADQKQKPLPCTDWSRATAGTQVMSAAEYSGWLTALSQAMQPGPEQPPIAKTKISADVYSGVQCFSGSTVQSAGFGFPLAGNTHTVVLRQPAGDATPCANIVFFQSPLVPDARALGQSTQSVLLDSASGQLLCEAPGQIGYETAFMFGGQHTSVQDTPPNASCNQSSAPFAGNTQADRDVWSFVTCPPGNMLLPDPNQAGPGNLMVWSPVYGASIDMANYGSIRTAVTSSTGYYTLPYTTMYPFTFSFNVNARIAFDSFNPRQAASHYFYMTGAGSAAAFNRTTFINFPVELTMVHVRATLGNPSGGRDVTPATLVGVLYKDLGLPANSTTYSGSVPGSEDIGLVQQISAPDLRDTDLFVYRVSDGRLIGSRWGLSSNEIGWARNATDTPKVNGGPAQFEVSALVRGPASRWLNVVTNAFNPATYTPPVIGSDGRVLASASFGLEVDYPEGAAGRNAYLREGDLVKVILVNRATGYIATRRAKLARGASGLPVLVEADGLGAATSANAAGGAALQFSLRPPNLKVRVHREYDIENGATKGESRDYVIGFEGSGLSSDKLITVETEWYDADGSALPDDLPGFTGRLAKTVLASEVPDPQKVQLPGGGTAPVALKPVDCGTDCLTDHVGMFSIAPGRHTHVIRLPEAQIDTSHFYVHLDAQPVTRNVDFQGRVDPGTPRFDVNKVCYRSCADDLCTENVWSCVPRFGAGSGPLEQRPSTYVPFLAPKYNKDVTEAAQKYASENHLAKPEPAYDWHYRPEMQFSIFDLDVKELTTRDEHGTQQDALSTSALPDGKGVVELIYSLTDPSVAALPGFSPDRQLAFTLGKQEVIAKYDSTTQTVDFNTPSAVEQLQSDDFLTIRLVQKGDEGNVLWEYGFEPIHIKLEGDVDSVAAGESVRALAVIVKDDRFQEKKAKWSLKGDPLSPEVDCKINADSGVITAAKDTANGWVTVRAEDAVDPLVFKDEKVLIGCAECARCKLRGGCEPKEHSVDAVFSLGRSSGGASAGGIFLRSHNPGPDLYTPKPLVFSTLDLRATPVYGADKVLRQVTAPETFVDIVEAGAEAYEIRFYDPLPDSVKPDEQTGLYPVSGTPDVVWRVGKPTPGSVGALRLSETRAGDNEPTNYDYQWDATASDWTLKRGNDTAEETHDETIVNGNRVVRVTIGDGSLASSVKEVTYQTFPFGEKAVAEVLGPGSQDLTTLTAYHEDPTHPGSYGRVASVSRPGGSWTRYQYDGQGRVTSETRPHLDSDVHALEAEAQVTNFDYAPVSSSGSSLTSVDVLVNPQDPESEEPRTVTETVGGTVVAKTFYQYERTSTGERTVTEERCSQQSCSFGASTSLRTVTEYYAANVEEASNGQVRSVRHPDNQLDSYTYEYGTYNAGSAGFFPGSGPAVRQTITHGTVQSPAGVAYKTTREVSITDERGRAVRDESFVYNGSTYELTSWTTRDYDERGHMTRSTSSSGELETASWGCCAEESTTDARGITTLYSRDDLQRVLISQRAGISTSYTYDGDGRELSATRDGGGVSLTSSKSYDLAGRVTESVDEAGLRTTFSYSPDGLQTVITRPGGFTQVNEQFVDGRQRSITGTAVVPQFFSYSVNPDGTQVTEVRVGNANSPAFERTVTDMLGRTVRVERPGFGGTLATSETSYNSFGQVARTRTTGLADMLYAYDELGHQIRSGLDVNGNGTLDLAGTDRIDASDSYFNVVEGQWWRESRRSVYALPSNSPIVISTSRTRLTGLGGGLLAEQVSIDLQGNETRTTVSIDPSSRTETRRTNVPDSSQDAVAVSVDGRLTSSTSPTGVTTAFDYDGLGRRTGVTDPRKGRSETHYDNGTGRVDYVKDAAGNMTGFAYELATGRKVSETNALGKSTYFAYDARGQLVRTWGDVPYPVEYVYDAYGRRIEMRTYRSALNFSTASWPDGAEMAADPTRWIYEEATGLLLQKQDAAGQAPQYTYDTAGRLKTRTWARPKVGGGALVTTYSYDPGTGDLASVDYNDSTPDVTYSYDRLGRQNAVADAAGSRTFGYDPATLQLSTETMTGITPAVLTHRYDTTTVKGRPVGITLGTNYDATYGYDTAGRMNSVNYTANSAHDIATYTYVPNSALLAGLTTQTGQTTAYSYEAHRDVKTQVQNKFGSTVVSQYDYAYDAIGRRTSVRNSGTAFAAAAYSLWGYDDRNELTSSGRYLGANIAVTTSPVPAQARSYAYDPIGNRQSSNSGGVPTSYIANALNEYTTVGAQSPSYDADGNLSNDGTKLVTYNAENQLLQVAPVAPVNGSKRVTFVYDYIGRRVRKVVDTFSGSSWSTSETKTWVYAGWNKLQESKTVGATTTVKSFVWGLDVGQSLEGAGGIGGLLASVDATGANLFAYDGNGNVSELLLTGGAINAHYEYDAFGNPIVSSGSGAVENCYRFSTKYQDDETGLYYYGYRYYAPATGRWLQRDPVGERGGLNLFAMVRNAPVDLVDLLGLDPAKSNPEVLVFRTINDWMMDGDFARAAAAYEDKKSNKNNLTLTGNTVAEVTAKLDRVPSSCLKKVFFVGHGTSGQRRSAEVGLDSYEFSGGGFFFSGVRPRGDRRPNSWSANNDQILWASRRHAPSVAFFAKLAEKIIGGGKDTAAAQVFLQLCFAGTDGGGGSLTKRMAQVLTDHNGKKVVIQAYTTGLEYTTTTIKEPGKKERKVEGTRRVTEDGDALTPDSPAYSFPEMPPHDSSAEGGMENDPLKDL